MRRSLYHHHGILCLPPLRRARSTSNIQCSINNDTQLSSRPFIPVWSLNKQSLLRIIHVSRNTYRYMSSLAYMYSMAKSLLTGPYFGYKWLIYCVMFISTGWKHDGWVQFSADKFGSLLWYCCLGYSANWSSIYPILHLGWCWNILQAFFGKPRACISLGESLPPAMYCHELRCWVTCHSAWMLSTFASEPCTLICSSNYIYVGPGES